MYVEHSKIMYNQADSALFLSKNLINNQTECKEMVNNFN